MADTVGIRFPNSGRTYCFKAEAMELAAGDRVVVESELGISIGSVAKASFAAEVPEQKLRPVLRKVTAADLQQEEENNGVRVDASAYCKERILERKLPMKLITTNVTLDRKRFIFYFTADSRIDFRELVKDLASKYRTRIELRQIGVRDAAKMSGGYGICGKEICCKTWLRSFAPISIKMAKQQDLVLNTCKLSGLCGRLLCCLNYEYVEGAPRQKRQKPPHKGAPEQQPAPLEIKAEEAPDVSVLAESAMVANAAPTSGESPEGQEKKDGASTERRHFKKGRRSRRSQAKQKAKVATDAPATDAGDSSLRKPDEVQPKGDSPATETKSKRRRRRRGKRRNPGTPGTPGSPGSSGGSGGSGSSGSSGGSGGSGEQK